MAEETNSTISDRAIAIWEIASAVTSYLIAEWVILAFVGNSRIAGAIPVVLALGLMIVSHRERRETLKQIGFRADNFLPALRLLFLPTLIAVVSILLAAWLRNQHLSFTPVRPRFILVPLWALFQQYALQGFINRRAQIVLGTGWKSILLVSVIFSALHLPNPMLTVLTLIGGFVWAAVYQRQPNLFALAISHTIASIVLALTLAQNLFLNLRVGFKYFG
jgi:hypothetical protein